MKAWHCLALYGLLLAIPLAVADAGIRQEVVRFIVITSYSIHYTKLYENDKCP